MAEDKNIATGYVGNALRSSAADHTTTFTDEVFDTERQKYQSEVNTELETKIHDEVARAQEAELANTTSIADETTRAMAAEEAIIYDVSSHNDGAVFESLQALLSSSNLSTLIPTSVRHGGMIIRFIQGSKQGYNKYTQARCMAQSFTTDVTQWQNVDDKISELDLKTSNIDIEIFDDEENAININNGNESDPTIKITDKNTEVYGTMLLNGKQVLNEHQSLDGKQDKIEQIEVSYDGNEEDEGIILKHDERTIMKISPQGVYSDFIYDSKGNHIGISGMLVVGENETYTTIQSAIDAAEHGQTIFIKDGEYKEAVIIKKYVHLVGASKHGVVLWNDDGHYENAPLMLTMGSVRNMTIYAKRDESKDYSFSERKCYAIHLDKNYSQNFGRCEIVNCNIVSDFDDAIGTGTNYSQVYDIHDCYIHATDKALDGAMAMKCHLGPNQTGGTIILRNNVFYAEKTTGIPDTGWDLQFNAGGITTDAKIDLLMIGNSLRSFKNAAPSNFVHNVNNWGNRVSEMNNE